MLPTRILVSCLLVIGLAQTAACTLRYGESLPDGTPADQVPWIDSVEYPFASSFLEVPGGSLHYIDEGPKDAPVIVLVHGTPTWSFLYRKVIGGLSHRYRCIALDHIGFGLSSKPGLNDFAHSPQAHRDNLIRLFDHLDLQDATLVIHDLGGPIGFGAALERPERIAKVAAINTFAWSLLDDDRVDDVDSFLRSGVGEWLYIKRNLSPEMILPDAFAKEHELTKDIHRHYTHPFADEHTRRGLHQIGLSLKGGAEFHQALWSRRHELQGKVQLLVFGLEDEFFGPPVFEKWKKHFPRARALGLEGIGHFPQEEAPEKVVRALLSLLE
jgi:haloalkane dehalogenase